MAWKDFCFGAVSVLGTEFLLAAIGIILAVLKSERATAKFLKAAKKLPEATSND